ncbi:MAG: redoxin domain-containing protein [Akkermansiaceae bacterium]|nr:redoxin domain-containing protein [Akkermansiaceae bacterium]
MKSRPRLSRGATVALSVLVTGLALHAAAFRNFNLPCLAPLLDQVDAEAPATINVAFLRGPTRAPELRDDLGAVDFALTTGSDEAAAHFNQGVALLHGLANSEAERSFRQALALDPKNPMVLWGLAVANEQRPQRARLFAQNALRRIRNETSPRERLFIESLARFHNVRRDGPAKLPPAETISEDVRRERHRRRIRDLESITLRFPDDIEAKAFLLRQLALDKHRSAIPITSHVAVDLLGREIAELAPKHPSRHYRIFLWLGERPQEALEPAETSPSLAPGIADSWRYAAEAWRANGRHAQARPLLEAALRVDHARMREHFQMPDDIDNLASNYTALIETLGGMGRVNDALEWTERMHALPRPLAEKKGAAGSGRFALLAKRLRVETLLRAELYDRLLDDLDSAEVLQPDSRSARDRAHWLYWKGLALAALDRGEETGALEEDLAALSMDPPSPAVRDEILELIRGLQTFRDLAGGKIPADPGFTPPDVPLSTLARAWAMAGRPNKARELAWQNLAARPGELLATAAFCEIGFSSGDLVTAMATFDRQFRENAMQADGSLPVFARLAPLAARMQLPKRWMLPASRVATPGAPADPDSLGPLVWTPPAAPEWTLPNHAGRLVSLKEFAGTALLLNFFLGVDCPYCVTQLNRFRPHLDEFEDAGIRMVAISTDTVESLAAKLGTEEEKTAEAERQFPYLIVADPELAVFKAYGVFDDFESGPMHATILVDPAGRVLWSDVAHGPFNHPESLLAESQRLLRRYSPAEAAQPE